MSTPLRSAFSQRSRGICCLRRNLRGFREKQQHKTTLLTMKTTICTTAVLGLAAVANAVTLTPDNWDSEVAGKTVFIKFQAPW